MATKFLDKTGLSHFWSKIKAWCNATFAVIAHTHTSYAVKHSYTTAANQAKAWLRIANANTHQMDTSKPLHVQFLLTAWNSDQPADYYEQWFIDCQVFGRNSGIRIFGASGAPFSQARVLYENTVADIDTNDRPAIDIYLNYALATACHVEIQEVYNSGWTFLADGVLATSTIPTGFENRAVGSQGSGVHQATYANYGTYTTLQRSNITANITLADNDTYRMRVLNCTNVITVTVPSLNSTYAWFLIKNFNAVNTNKNVTIHPSTTSVLIDDSNADIILKPGEWVIIASKAANSYSLIGDSRWKSQKADKATTLAGYGITDAKIANGTITLGSNSITPLTSHQTLPTLSRTISGSGNAITDITVSGHAITATKGATFLTSHQTLPTLSLTTSGNGNAITALSVSDHAITATKGASYITSSGSITGNAATATKTIATVAVDTTGELVRATMGTNDVFRIAVGGASNAGWAEIATGDDYSEPIYVRQYQGAFTTLKRTATLLDGSGNTSFPGTVTATGFSGPLTGDVTGNATTVSGTAGTSALAWNSEVTLYTVGGHAIKVKLPANPNTDTHWTSHLYAGASNGNANAATTNGNTYLIICDNSTARDRRLIKGTGATTVTSDADGVITIHSTDNNTTYSTATQSANGLMSAADKKKLDGISAGADSIPVGAIIYYTHKTVPANFLICNGGAVSRTTYATLFKLIGTTYGAGNRSSTFNVPNLINRFPQGNATPGTVKAAGLPNITGYVNYRINTATGGYDGCFSGTNRQSGVAYPCAVETGNLEYWNVCFSANSSSPVYGNSATVQPPALTLVPCIRYA